MIFDWALWTIRIMGPSSKQVCPNYFKEGYSAEYTLVLMYTCMITSM